MLILLLFITRLHLLLCISITSRWSKAPSFLTWIIFIVFICLPAFLIAVLSILHLTDRMLLKIIIIKYDYTFSYPSFRIIQWLLIGFRMKSLQGLNQSPSVQVFSITCLCLSQFNDYQCLFTVKIYPDFLRYDPCPPPLLYDLRFSLSLTELQPY